MEMLESLDLRDHEGLSAAEVAARLGKTRAAVLGVWQRIRDAEAPGAAGDGSLPRGWWRR